VNQYPIEGIRITCFNVMICYVCKSNTLASLLFLYSALAHPVRVADWLSLVISSSRGTVAPRVPSSLSHRACPVASFD
jgi:hypothetical protein